MLVLLALLLCLVPLPGKAQGYFNQITVFSQGRITRFAESPIRVFLLPPPEEYANYLQAFEYALEQWHGAVPEAVVFRRVEQPEEAHIQVRWASYSLNQVMDHALGDAKLVRDSETTHHVEITLSLRDKRTGKRLSEAEMRTVCLHELGHALGLWGHSPDVKDVMYYAAEAQELTERDKITIRQVYAAPPNAPQHESAIAVLQGWIDKAPETPRYLYLLGTVYQDAGNYDAAVDAYLRCLELDMFYRPAAEALVVSYQQLGRPREALMQAEAILQADPTPQAYNMVGGLYYQQKEFDKARECFQKAVELDPRYRPARHNLFVLLREQAGTALEHQQYALALEAAQHALRLNPTDAPLWILLGNAHVALHQYPQAINAYQEAQKHAPNDPVIRENLGRTYNNWGVWLVQQGEYRAAIEKYRMVRQLCPELTDVQANLEDAYWRMARHLVESGQVEEGIAVYRELLQVNPKLTEIHAIIGGLYYQEGNYPEALASFRAALEANPDLAEARYNLFATHIQYGQALDRQRRYAEAIDQFQAAVALKPESVDAYLLLAQTYRHAQQYEEALQTLQKALMLAPDNETVQKAIANVFIQRGNQLMRAKKYRQAAAAFEQIPQPQKTVDIYNMLAYLYLSAGDLMKALPPLQAAMRLKPKDRVTYQNLLSLESQLARRFDPRPGKEKPGVRDQLARVQAQVAQCLLLRRKYSAAKKKYRAAWELHPSSAEARQVLRAVGTELLQTLRQIGWTKNAEEVATWIQQLGEER